MEKHEDGVLSDDVETAIKNVKAGQVRFRTDKKGSGYGKKYI